MTTSKLARSSSELTFASVMFRREYVVRYVRLSDAAAPLEMVAAARRAAARSSTDTLVSARGKTRAVSLWDELATWDPGD